ncbi:MAG TPA: histidine kinase [Microscillaceae bacterium]|nr:histidine kinase [Microscillaceae bacterium]
MIKKLFHKITPDIWLQALFVILFFLTKALDRHHTHLHNYDFYFFANYLVAVILINYWLLPRFFYKKKYVRFALGVITAFAVVMLVEELVLEKIFFPRSRGNSFPGVIHTLGEVAPTIIVFIGIKMGWDIHVKQKEMDRLKNLMSESELKFLKTQINPHFLFNNLNNLYSYALANSPQTPKIILQLSSLLRYMLYEGAKPQVPLAKEVKYLQDFVALQQLQIDDRGLVTFEVEGVIDNQVIAPLILVVFIENCFKHSTSSQTEGIRIDIHLTVNKDQLRLYCSNTYSLEQNNDNIAKGIGLKNVQARLQLLYPQRHSLVIKDQNNLYEVNLELDLTS